MASERIALYCMHTSLDVIKGGNNDWLIQGLGVREPTPIEPNKINEEIGVGRMGSLEKTQTLGEMINLVKKVCGLSTVMCAVKRLV